MVTRPPETLTLHVTWAEVAAGVRNLAAMVEASDFKPDLIISPTRGGLTIGVMLSHRMDIPMMAVNLLAFEYQTFVLDFTTNSLHYLKHLENPKVLIVDEICDTGETMKTIKRDLLEVKGSLEIKTAALHQRLPEGLLVADYYTQVIEDVDMTNPPIWMVYPWEPDGSTDYSDLI